MNTPLFIKAYTTPTTTREQVTGAVVTRVEIVSFLFVAPDLRSKTLVSLNR